MKKITAFILTASMVLASVPVLAADNGMENVLISVKSRIDVPSELNVFSSSVYKNGDETGYLFSWRDADYTANISVNADGEGHIDSYNYSYDSLYSGTGTYTYKSREEYQSAAEDFLKKAAPELFESGDRLEVISDGSAIRDNTADFYFKRTHNGIPVTGNDVYAEVRYSSGEFVVTCVNINWDYNTGFDDSKKGVDPGSYYDLFPLEMAYTRPVYYRIQGDNKKTPDLVYRFKDNNAGFMSAVTGEVLIADDDERFRTFDSAKGMGAAADESAESVLTPEERIEIDNIKGLRSADDIIESVNKAGVFGYIPEAGSFAENIYKADDRYIVGLNYEEYGETAPDKPASVYISADGQTGELLSMLSYYGGIYDGTQNSDYSKAENTVSKFLKDNYFEKISQCGEAEILEGDMYSVCYPRLVNGIKYDNNNISIGYDMYLDIITHFNQNWDKDVSGFVDPSQAIGYDEAIKKIGEYDPVYLTYVKSDEKFRLGYTSDGDYTAIDALTGKKMYENDLGRFSEFGYSDISGHWAEEMIKAVALYGVGLPGEKFEPDKEITQAEFLRMLAPVGNYWSDDIDELYKEAKDIIPDSEKSPDKPVVREDSFMYIIRLMGYSKIASMYDIFKPGFMDGINVSAEKAGALAILRGFGIVQGDNDEVRPKDKLTRAEAAALIYNYLTTEK